MAQSVTLNGSSFSIPDVGENDWGQNVTDFLVAIPGAVLQKSGGAFALTAEVDFGATYGLKTAYYKSQTANPASAGQVRLAVADTIKFRNNANGGDLAVAIDAADALTFGGSKVVTVAGGFTFVGTNTFANQKGIRLMEQTGNGVNYIEVVAPDAVTANVTLKLPDGVGSAGQVLSTDGSGVLSWINAAGGGTINTGVVGRLALYPSNGTTIDDVVTLTNTISVVIASHGQGSVYTIPDTGAATADFVMNAGAQTIAGAKTLSGATVISNNSIAAFTISQASSFKVDSTNALVSIGTTTMTYPLYISKSSAGANVTLAVENSESANGASHARLYVITGGASGGDPFQTFYNGVVNWSVGLDNSDSDKFKMSRSAALGTTDIVEISSTIFAVVGADFSTNRSAAATTVEASVINSDNSSVSSHALLRIESTSGSGGDPFLKFVINGATTWSIGPDNSVADQFVISKAASLGTSNFFTANVAGEIGLGPEAVCVATCAVNIEQTVSGSNMIVRMGNNASNAASGAQMLVFVADTSSGDPYLRFAIGSSTDWSFGTDNSDSNRLKMSQSSAIGTNDVFVVDPTTLGVSIRGTNTNDSAAAGYVGEVVTSTVTTPTNFAATGAYADLTSITLSAGDWDIDGFVEAVSTGATWTGFRAGITSTSGNSGTGIADGDTSIQVLWASSATTPLQESVTIPMIRVQLTGSTTYYLKYRGNYTVGTPQAVGRITARRRR